MKKAFTIIIVVVILLVSCIYIFIPNHLTVSNLATFYGSSAGTNRGLTDKKNWEKFWPGTKQITPSPDFSSNDLFVYKEDTFRIRDVLHNALRIDINARQNQVQSLLTIIPLQQEDSMALTWTYTKQTSLNPFTRLQQYQQAVAQKSNLTAILHTIKDYLSKDENVYGISIQQTSTNDTLLISTNTILNHYPATADIYTLINKLQFYALSNGALQTGSPLLNITQVEMKQYKVMAAIPLDKLLVEKDGINLKKMVKGNFLTTTIVGDNQSIINASKQMQLYFQDFHRVAMAIPFQVLAGDRRVQPDSSKWITKLYFPVM